MYSINKELLFRKAFFVIGFSLLLFVTCLSGFTDNNILKFLLKHLDEGLVICLTIYVLLNINYISHKKIIIFFALFLLCGFIPSVFIFRYQSIIAVIFDSMIISRFIIGYYSLYIYTLKHSKVTISDDLVTLSKLLSLILFVFTIHDLFFSPFFEKSDFRFFTNSMQLMFQHPTYLAHACATLLIFMAYKSRDKSLIKYMIAVSFVIFMTFRTKAMAFVIVFWVFYVLMFIIKSRNTIIKIIISIIIAVYIANDQLIGYYLSSSYSPRSIMLHDSISLMFQNFPFGTGFATFGSSVAIDYYSPIYESLGYQHNYGMSQNYSAFLNDCFWPEIMAQFGVFGLVLFIVIIIQFFKIAVNKKNANDYSNFAMIMTLVYVLIASLAESSFFNPASFLMFMLFAVYENNA